MLRDRLDQVIDEVLREHGAADVAGNQAGTDAGRGEAADALQDLQAARNALLDAAARWEQARR